MSDDFTRGWHDGYRAARDDVVRILGCGPGSGLFSRVLDWADGYPPVGVAMSEPPETVV